MDPDRILNLPKFHKATFIWLLILLFVLLLLIENFLVGTDEVAKLASTYIHAIASAILTALFVLWIVKTFMPPTGLHGGIVAIEPKNITAEFDQLLSDANRWRYKGNFGRYMRGKVLPVLAGRSNIQVSVCILDPLISDLCEQHAAYRNKINSIGGKYDAEGVALEVIVTIVICGWYVANKDVSIDLYLTRVFDPVRIDSNDTAMILTVEDRRKDALKITKDHFSYEHFDLQMKFTREQARPLNLKGMRKDITLAALSEDDITDFLSKRGMGDICKQLTAKRICEACKNSKNPYEN